MRAIDAKGARGERERGFSLLEAVVSAGILGVMVVSLLVALPKWRDSFEDNNAAAANNDKARDVFTMMCDEIRESGASSPDWDLQTPSDGITFNKCIGSWTTTKLWGPSIRYWHDAENDTLVRTSEGISQTLCGNVKSLAFTPEGNNVRVTLEVEIQGARGRTLTGGLSGLASPRN